mgnify:CR=1 FL=1
MSHLWGERRVLLFYFLTDLVLLWLAFSVVTLARLNTLPQVDFLLIQRDRFLCSLVFAVSALLAGCYRDTRITDRFDSVYYSTVAMTVAMVLELAVVTLVPTDLRVISRREILLGNCLGTVFLSAWHFGAAGFVARFAELHRYFYVIGEPAHGVRIAAEIRRARSVQADAQFVTFEDLVQRYSTRETTNSVTEEVIIASRGALRDQLHDILAFCEVHCRRTFLYPSVWDTLLFQHSSLSAIAGIPLVEVAGQRRPSSYRLIKRAIDLWAAAVGILLASPLIAATALAIKLTSPGPVFYAQERLGMGGQPFHILKFRSMHAGTELKKADGYTLASEHDPRITPIGRFIRKHRIDELPQLFNVLKGDMSLIGPRPVWREYYETQGGRENLFRRRLDVRPGLTSLSHILGSYSSAPEDRIRYDLIYISNLSFSLDLKILVATIRIVLSGKGAQ